MEKSQLETKRRINASPALVRAASAPGSETWTGTGKGTGNGDRDRHCSEALALFLSKSSLIKCSVFTVEIF